MLRIIDGGVAASPVSRCSVREERSLDSQDTPLRHGVREHIERLRLIQSVVSLSVMALRRQDAERDEDIASVLDHHAAVQLSDEVCQLEGLLDQVEGSPIAPAAMQGRCRTG